MRYLISILAITLSIGLLVSACDHAPQEGVQTVDSPKTSEAGARASLQGLPEQASLSQQFRVLRKATRKYQSIEEARADGYVAVSPYVPGMGFHFANGSPFGTTLEDPGVLVYYTTGSYNPSPGDLHEPTHDDDLILGAVEYLVPGDQATSPPNIFNDETSSRNLKVTEAEGWHFESAEGFTGLHAWIYRGNAAGVFHHTNPNVD